MSRLQRVQARNQHDPILARPVRPKYRLLAQFRNRETGQEFRLSVKEGDRQNCVVVTRNIENLRDHCLTALLQQSGIYLRTDLIEVEETTIELVK